MRATVQSKLSRAASSKFGAEANEKDPLQSTLSTDAFEQGRQRKVEKFLQLCEELGKEAEANGLTDEILAEILAEE